MRDYYKNNQEITTFFSKAQNRIAQLAENSASEDDYPQVEKLLLELSDFLESLDSPYCNYTITNILRYIHYYNNRAKLVELPYIEITSYLVNILGNSSPDLANLDARIKDAIGSFPHNSLVGLQGGSLLERFHLSKEMYDWLAAKIQETPLTPIVQPTVGLVVDTVGQLYSSGYYELGSGISPVLLQGTIQLNSGKTILSTVYKKNGSTIPGTLTTLPTNSVVNSYVDKSLVKSSITYSFEAEFEVGGIKTASKTLNFLPPFYYGILKRNAVSNTTVKTLTKDVQNISSTPSIVLSFTLPVGNSLVKDSDYTPVVEFPLSFGIPKSVKAQTYDFKSDWTFTQVATTLKDGTATQSIRGVFNNSLEGLVTFTFEF